MQLRRALGCVVIIALASVSFDVFATSPLPPPPPAGWDKCSGEPINLSAEAIYTVAIREFERIAGPLPLDKHRITIRPNGCAWWVQFEFIPRDSRGKFGVIVDKVTGKATWRGWLDV